MDRGISLTIVDAEALLFANCKIRRGREMIQKFGIICSLACFLGGCVASEPLVSLEVRQHQVGMDLSPKTVHEQCRWPKVQSANYLVEAPENDAAVLKWVMGLVVGDFKALEDVETATHKTPISSGAVGVNQNWHALMRFDERLQEEVWRRLGWATTPEAADLLPSPPQACRGECLEAEANHPNVKAVVYRADGKLMVNDLRYCSYALSETETREGVTSVRIMRSVFDRQRGEALKFKEVIRASHEKAVCQLLAQAFEEESVSAGTLENFDFTPQGIRWTMSEGVTPKTARITWETLAPHLVNSSLATRFVNEIVLLFPQSYAEIKLPSVEFKQVALVDVLTLFSDFGPCQGCHPNVKRVAHAAKRGQTLFISFGGDFLNQLSPAIDERITSDAALPQSPFKTEITVSCSEMMSVTELVALLNDQLSDYTLRIEWVGAAP